LILASSQCLSDTTNLTISGASTRVQLEAGVKEKVGSLVLGSTTNTTPAIWGSTSSIADIKTNFFLVTGLLYVNLEPPPPPVAGTIIRIQ
jgi:hypothetical protein